MGLLDMEPSKLGLPPSWLTTLNPTVTLEEEIIIKMKMVIMIMPFLAMKRGKSILARILYIIDKYIIYIFFKKIYCSPVSKVLIILI